VSRLSIEHAFRVGAVYTGLDCRLMIEDLFAKLQLHARAEETP
jgi:hypothetical protein